MQEIKLVFSEMYRDGGTEIYKGSDGNAYYEDKRIGTKTHGAIYMCYPDGDEKNIVPKEVYNTFVFVKWSLYYHNLK